MMMLMIMMIMMIIQMLAVAVQLRSRLVTSAPRQAAVGRGTMTVSFPCCSRIPIVDDDVDDDDDNDDDTDASSSCTAEKSSRNTSATAGSGGTGDKKDAGKFCECWHCEFFGHMSVSSHALILQSIYNLNTPF